MYIAKITYPEKALRTLSCDSCSCSYNTKDYKILFDNNKIKYFKVQSTFVVSSDSISLCHGCLLDSAKSIAGSENVTFVIQAEQHEYIVEFTPEPPKDGEGNENFTYDDDDNGDDSMEDFLKDLE